MSVQRVELDPDAIVREAANLTAADLDELPFGTIHLDPAGMIRSYNRAEEKISGRKRQDVVGRNFFRDVAPCTRVQRFFGTFQEGVSRKELNEIFDFSFRFPAGTRDVRIRMIYSESPVPGVWIFVTPMQLM
jgi:photoactive yellow protein